MQQAEIQTDPVPEAAEAPPKNTRGIRRSVPLQCSITTRAKIRNLYVVQMLPAREVAKECGVTEKQIYNLARHHRWVELRRERIGKMSAPLQARENEQVEEISRAAAMLSDEGLLGSIIRANEATQSRSEFASKDAQAFASAARSLMQIGRTLRGLDSPSAKGGGDVTNNLIFVGAGAIERVRADAALPDAKPCIDVTTTASESPAAPANP